MFVSFAILELQISAFSVVVALYICLLYIYALYIFIVTSL